MTILYCWRCKTEVPMLNEEEYAKACELYSEAIRNTNGEEDRLIRYKALIDYYKEITGWD